MICSFLFNSTDCLYFNPAPSEYVVTGSTLVDATPTVQCAAEYSGTPASVTCQTDGSWHPSFSGCYRGEQFNTFRYFITVFTVIIETP